MESEWMNDFGVGLFGGVNCIPGIVVDDCATVRVSVRSTVAS